MDDGFSLKPTVLLGVSSSALQIDGGRVANSWSALFAEGGIKDGADPAEAAGHWSVWREDVELMHSLGVQTATLGVEWARVEPEEGVFDEEAIVHVKEELMLMTALGIAPVLVLHHFSNPLWFENRGGWTKPDNVRCYLIYVEKMVKSLGHLCREYITVCDAAVYAEKAYLGGGWYPEAKSLSLAFAVMSNMATAHIKAYRLIHDMRRSMGFHDSRVGFQNAARVYAPQNESNPLHRRNAASAERLFQTLPARAMLMGDFAYPMKNAGRDRRGAYSDFHAVSYFGRVTVGAMSKSDTRDAARDDLGRELYPAGLIECCEKLRKIAPIPIYVTECGVCDLNDSFRRRFIYEQLREIALSKLPIKRFYLRSFLDGFEYLDGRFPRYGIVEVDQKTLERRVKESGKFYSKVIEKHGVTQEMYDECVKDESYHH